MGIGICVGRCCLSLDPVLSQARCCLTIRRVSSEIHVQLWSALIRGHDVGRGNKTAGARDEVEVE